MPMHKCLPYDTDLRVPFMIRGPQIAANQTLSHIAANIDLAATMADLGGVPPPNR